MLKPIAVTKPKTKESNQISYYYAFILVVLLLSQLFTFDELLKLVSTFGIVGGVISAYILCGLIVISELLAIPFLINMSIHPVLRVISMVSGWLVPIIWCVVSIWLVMGPVAVNNIGILGTKFELLPGWWAVYINIAIGILAAWASWGSWPLKKA